MATGCCGVLLGGLAEGRCGGMGRGVLGRVMYHRAIGCTGRGGGELVGFGKMRLGRYVISEGGALLRHELRSYVVYT